MARWGAAVLLLLTPLVAMQFTDEVTWDETDFMVAAALLFGACGAYELTSRITGSTAYRAAAATAIAAALVLIWINLAVGIIGSEDDPANLMYGGVLAVGIIGAVIARFRAQGMTRALVAVALAQALVAVIAIIAGMGYPVSPPLELLLLNGFFAALWLIAAWLFWKAAREQTSAGAAP